MFSVFRTSGKNLNRAPYALLYQGGINPLYIYWERTQMKFNHGYTTFSSSPFISGDHTIETKYHRDQSKYNKRLPGAWIVHLLKFLPFKGNNSKKELADNFDSMKTLIGLIIRIISSNESFILSIIVFKILTENC